jgi:hypothetical protein
MTGKGANGKTVVGLWGDVGKIANAVDVDNHLGASETHAQKRHKALASCQYLGVLTTLMKKV